MPTFNFQSINVPNPVFSYVYISVNGVDSDGDAVGNYGDSDGNYLGFLRASITALEAYNRTDPEKTS